MLAEALEQVAGLAVALAVAAEEPVQTAFAAVAEGCNAVVQVCFVAAEDCYVVVPGAVAPDVAAVVADYSSAVPVAG